MTQPTGGYTTDEIASATSALVQTSIQYKTDSLGVRQTATTFSDVQQAAIGVFLLFQTAPFYVVQLGCSRLNEELQQQATNVDTLLTLVQAAGRTALPVNDITPLSNASAALFQLQGAAASRTVPFSSIQGTPAYQNFSTNVDQFLAANGSNVVSGGQIVPTPQDAKSQIGPLFAAILSTQQDIITKAGYLQNALVDYNSADLPAVATSSVFQNATQNIATLVAQLETQTPTQRLSSLRNTVLQLLAARAVVGGMGSPSEPSNIYPISGTGTPYSDTSHLAIPATLDGTKYAPYAINGTPLITLALDGQPAQSANLSNSLFAELFGVKTEPFVISALTPALLQGSTAGPFTVALNSFAFTVAVPNSGPVQINLFTTLIGSQTAVALATDLNTQFLNNYPGASGLYQITTDGTHTYLVIEAVSSGASYGITINPGVLNSIVGFTTGQTVTGTDNGTGFVIKETSTSTVYSETIPAGSYSAAAFAAYFNGLGIPFTAYAQGNVGFQFIDIRYTGIAPAPTFSAGIQFPSANNPVAVALGMTLGITMNAQPSTARSVAQNLNQLFFSLNATTAVDPVARGSNISIRSDVTDPSRFVAYLTTGTGTATGGVNTVSLATPSGLLEAGVEVGDVVVFRSGANANTKWTITVLADDSLTATGVGVTVSGTCTYEIGPKFLTVTPGYVVQIASGINAGIYTITQQGPTALTVPFEFEVNAVIHGVAMANGLPYVVVGNIGQEKVVFNSMNTTIASAISVSGAGSSLFFTGTAPFTAVGMTPWLQLPQSVPSLGKGDVAAYFGSQYNVPSQSFTITSVNGQIVGIAPPISDSLTLPFNDGIPPPFALLESGAYAAFQMLSSQLETWVDQDANQNTFFSQIQLALNIVMTESQTTATQVNTAIAMIQQLQNLLVQMSSSEPAETLEYALDNYSVNRVAPIDSLVTTYTEKGCDAAIDTLLQGQFAEFFGLTQDGVSYAGALQAQTRTVALNDLPVRKVDRTSTVTSPVVGSTTSPDFEYDSSDIDQTTPPQTPTMFEQVSPTDANNP